MPNATTLPGKETLNFLENSMAAQKLHQIDRSFEGEEEKNRFQREIRANGSQILPAFCQFTKVKP